MSRHSLYFVLDDTDLQDLQLAKIQKDLLITVVRVLFKHFVFTIVKFLCQHTL